MVGFKKAIRKNLLICIFLVSTIWLVSCGPAVTTSEEKGTTHDSWTLTILNFFQVLEEKDKDGMQSILRGIDELSRNNNKETQRYLMGIIEGVDHGLSPCHIVTTLAPEENVSAFLTKDLYNAFERSYEVEGNFIDAIYKGIDGNELTNASSHFFSLMPSIWDAMGELYQFNLADENVDEEGYCEALISYSERLEEAIMLLGDE